MYNVTSHTQILIIWYIHTTAYPDIPQADGPEVLEFRKNSVLIAFQWTQAYKKGISYIIDTIPLANNITYLAVANVQLQVSYNTIYNVSMRSSCGQSNVTIETSNILLNFSEFTNLMMMIIFLLCNQYTCTYSQMYPTSDRSWWFCESHLWWPSSSGD